MADEIIEKYLRDKLDHAIIEIEQPEYYQPPKLQNLKNLLHPSPRPSEQNLQKLTRARLYSLDNLLTEWQMHSKKQAFFSRCSLGLLRLDCNFANSFKRIMEETPKKENGTGTAPHGAQPTPQGAEGSSTAPNGQTRPPSSHDPASSARKEEAFRWSTRLVDTEKIHGLEDKIKSLQRLLVPRKDDEFKMIGIGQTGLCQVIFDKKEVRKHYHPRIWVCMSTQPSDNKEPRKEIVKRMLECLGIEAEINIAADKSHELKELLSALRLQLVGKRYLIVLDDVWSTAEQYKDFFSPLDQKEEYSEKLAYGLPKECGGAIIVTSRTEEVATAIVGKDNLHQLPPHSEEDKIKSLQRLLVPREDDDAEFKTIGIVGMRGIGKTALCQVIFDKKEVRKHYLPRIWVCMSKQPGENKEPRKEIVKRMLECLGVEIITAADDIHELKKLLFALRLQLVGKRYLIVLDDVWSTAEQYKDFCSSLDQEEKCSEKLAYGLPKGCGGAIIVTSRSEEVAAAMVGEDNLYRLPPLSEESCWKIFKDSFEEDGKQLSPALINLGSKIKEKCAGLPLAAKMMGQIAREQPAAPASGQAESQQEEQQAN